jgi:hypothetical protein
MNAQTENSAVAVATDAMFGALADDDPDFDAELFARDPVFDRATQAEIRRRVADMDAGRNVVYHDIIETKP